jgi:undecaprenyl-diphosphatase
VDSLIVFVAEYFLYLSVLIVVGYWLTRPTSTKIELALRLLIGGVLALAMARIGGHLYYNPRPFVVDHVTPLFAHAADNGFPSDHALLTSFLGLTMWRYSRAWSVVLLVNAVLVSAARVAAHVHHPLDIVGSFVFSALAVAITSWIAKDGRLTRRWRR